jgi:hypothetical protein
MTDPFRTRLEQALAGTYTFERELGGGGMSRTYLVRDDAHGHGIVHRDIKPDNVLLSAGSATVTDFGIAKAISASRTSAGADATLTQAGMAIGTPAYMAPEQAAADPDLDHRADLYAFGAMAYELLGGGQLFAGRTPARVLAAQLGEMPRDVREVAPDIPPELGALVMQCLAKDPDARPTDAGAIVRALDAAVAGGSVSTSRAATDPAPGLGPALARWGGISAAVLAATWGATEFVGLPDWALLATGGVLLAGLPAVVGTWWVQRTARRAGTATPTRTPGGSLAPPGTMATLAQKARPHVSWTRTWRAGAAAIGVLALLVAGYVTTRALGVGPVASLIGKGAFGERETIVVADFRPPADDTLVGTTVAEALRTDLAQSANLAVLTRATVRDILDRMQRPRESAVFFPLAREIATREGARSALAFDLVAHGDRLQLYQLAGHAPRDARHVGGGTAPHACSSNDCLTTQNCGRPSSRDSMCVATSTARSCRRVSWRARRGPTGSRSSPAASCPTGPHDAAVRARPRTPPCERSCGAGAVGQHRCAAQAAARGRGGGWHGAHARALAHARARALAHSLAHSLAHARAVQRSARRRAARCAPGACLPRSGS